MITYTVNINIFSINNLLFSFTNYYKLLFNRVLLVKIK